MNELTHLDLFSGIGGFALAARWAGFRTIGFAEINPFAVQILKQRFPEVPNFGDVRTVVAPHRLTVITCGDPCQRNSNAWRHGSGDESPAVYGLSIIAASRPRFVLRENPSVVRKDAPWPWHRFRDELEKLGYAVLPIRIRACCLGADHRRERMLLLAELSDANRTGLERDERQELARAIHRRHHANIARSAWRKPASRICRASDGIPKRVDRIEALGNAIDPRIAYPIFKAIHETEKGLRA